jgi:hypothetical protein
MDQLIVIRTVSNGGRTEINLQEKEAAANYHELQWNDQGCYLPARGHY